MARMGQVRNDGCIGFRAWRTRAALGHHAHTHHDVEINHIATGWCEYVLAGRRVRLEAGRCYLFWGTIPHQMVDIAPDTQMGWVVFPVNWLWHWRVPSHVAAALLEGNILADAQPEPEDSGSIGRWGQMLSRGEPEWTRVAELEVEARIRRMMLCGPEHWTGTGHSPPPRTGHRVEPMGRVGAMAAYLTANSHKRIAVADVARHVNLEPGYAMRLFRKHMNMTILDYLTRQRIAEAKRRLLTSNQPLMSIAYDCGFGSLSRFYEAFEQVTNTTPARFRKMTRSG